MVLDREKSMVKSIKSYVLATVVLGSFGIPTVSDAMQQPPKEQIKIFSSFLTCPVDADVSAAVNQGRDTIVSFL